MKAGIKITCTGAPCFSGPFCLVEAEQVGLGFKGGGVVAGVWGGEEGLGASVLSPRTVTAVSPALLYSDGPTPGLTSLARSGL